MAEVPRAEAAPANHAGAVMKETVQPADAAEDQALVKLAVAVETTFNMELEVRPLEAINSVREPQHLEVHVRAHVLRRLTRNVIRTHGDALRVRSAQQRRMLGQVAVTT